MVPESDGLQSPETRPPDKKRQSSGLLKRVLLCSGIALFLFFTTAAGALLLIHYGPSKTLRDALVIQVTEHHTGEFLATWFLSDEEIAAIREQNHLEAAWPQATSVPFPSPNDPSATPAVPSPTPFIREEGVEVIPISGKTFVGKMLIVSDPSRVFVGTPPAYGEEVSGLTVKDMAKRYDALAAVNGGGFWDVDVKGTGGIPSGNGWSKDSIVISNGELRYGQLNHTYTVIGITRENKLLLRRMTAQEALDLGVRDAVEFTPFLIVDGQPCEFSGSTAEKCEARTVIGQREDGTILLLVAEGRQPNSIGATFPDLIEIMLKYGAVNAANLDGGQSSYMVYENEIITSRALLYSTRKIATTILISRVGGSHEPH